MGDFLGMVRYRGLGIGFMFMGCIKLLVSAVVTESVNFNRKFYLPECCLGHPVPNESASLVVRLSTVEISRFEV